MFVFWIVKLNSFFKLAGNETKMIEAKNKSEQMMRLITQYWALFVNSSWKLKVLMQRPGDNVFVHIDPGENYTYEYQIEDDHPAGTFWYHAHLHGSTMFQVSFLCWK